MIRGKQAEPRLLGERWGYLSLGSLDKRHFVGVRFVLSNTHISLSLGSLLSALIKQSLIWVPSPVPGKKKEACYFEESRVNNTDKRFRHKKEEMWGRVRVKGGEITRHPILFRSLVGTAEPLWSGLNWVFLAPQDNFFVSRSVRFCGYFHMLWAHPKQIKTCLNAAIVPSCVLTQHIV